MVTVEQGEGQFQGSTNTTQTGVPQQAPANLQPNAGEQTNIQNVVNSTNLFSNPQANAVITISGSSGKTAESLVASEVDTFTNPSSSWQPTVLFLLAAVMIISGSFLIIRKFADRQFGEAITL